MYLLLDFLEVLSSINGFLTLYTPFKNDTAHAKTFSRFDSTTLKSGIPSIEQAFSIFNEYSIRSENQKNIFIQSLLLKVKKFFYFYFLVL